MLGLNNQKIFFLLKLLLNYLFLIKINSLLFDKKEGLANFFLTNFFMSKVFEIICKYFISNMHKY